MFDSLRPHGLQHTRPPCPSLTPRVYANSCLLSWWCHPTISPSVIPFSSHLQSFPVAGSFQMTQFFASGSQSIGVSASASVLPMNIQNWFPFWLTGLISLQSKKPLWHFNLPTCYPPTPTSSVGMRMVVQILGVGLLVSNGATLILVSKNCHCVIWPVWWILARWVLELSQG